MAPPGSETFTYETPTTANKEGIQSYTITVGGTYEITAIGAAGGSGFGTNGGLGAEASAEIALTVGSVIDILVGGQGGSGSSNFAAGGGGGGSFVVAQQGAVALVVGGGGGGGGFVGTDGSDGEQTQASSGDGGPSVANYDGNGGGGGGFIGDGETGNGPGPDTAGSEGGRSFINGGAGGTGADSDGDGGFGGGGGGGYFGGGGGGGFSGGSGGSGDTDQGGGGGGSYVISTALSLESAGGAERGNGKVTIDLLCFLAGTAIATPVGDVAVEALRVGNLICTADGRAVTLRWIGRREMTAAKLIDRELHYPVRICRDAIGPGVPARDLRMTGDHAILVDGLLIPSRLLVNGASIRAERAITDFTYFHLELDQHALVLAEGLAAESYLDTGNRHMFSEDDAIALASPSRTSAAEVYAVRGVASLTLAPEMVEPVWRRLAERAGAVSVPLPRRPDATTHYGLHLLTDGRRIQPSYVEGDRAMFVLPAGTREAQLTSGVARPSDMRPWLDDRRRLGLKVRRITLHADGAAMDIPLDGPQLGSGWHGVENAGWRAARWTAGNAQLYLPASTNTLILELKIAGAMVHGQSGLEAN